MLRTVHHERQRVTALSNWQTAMKDDRVIASQPHRTAPHDKRHVFPETRARNEGLPEAIDAGALVRGKFVWIRPVDGWEMRVAQRINAAVDLHCACGMIDSVEQIAVLHFPFRMTPA